MPSHLRQHKSPYFYVQKGSGFVLLDTQWVTEHLTQFGAHEIPRSAYLKALRQALPLPCSFA